MRQIYLVNQRGATWAFDHRTSSLVSSIGNLGVQRENVYLDFGDRYRLAESGNPMTQLDFGVVFLKGYEGYSDFLGFVRESTELRLFYSAGGTKRHAYVAFKSITKTQLEGKAIQSTLSLDKLSLWLNTVTYRIDASSAGGGKEFPFPYPHRYSPSFDGEVAIANRGEGKAPLRIVIEGAVSNPRLDIMDGDAIVSTLRLLVKSSACVIEVNSEESDQYMRMTENGTTRSVYQDQDFSCDNFLFLAKGEKRARFTPGVGQSTSCTIQVTEGYGGN